MYQQAVSKLGNCVRLPSFNLLSTSYALEAIAKHCSVQMTLKEGEPMPWP